MGLPRTLFRAGLPALLGLRPGKIDLDFEGGRIRSGRREILLAGLRCAEFQRGYLTLGDGATWMTIDLLRYRDDSGPLVKNGALSASALLFIEALRQNLLQNTGGGGEPPPPLDLRYRVRIDRMAIAITFLSVAIFLGDIYLTTDEWPVSLPGLLLFLALLGFGTAALFVQRRSARLRLDGEGISSGGLFGSRFYPWNDIREFRSQHTEAELAGSGFRLPLTLDLLMAGNTPIILRRGRYVQLSPPGRLLLDGLRAHVPERAVAPLELTPGERRSARWWIGGVVALNAAVFFLETRGGSVAFETRLVELGARTSNWVHEPWRLLTSLFLHGSLSHIFFNMLMLAVLAPWMGRIYGWARTWALYLASGVLGNVIGDLISRWLRPPAPGLGEQVGVGASTAILGLLGALLAVTYRWPERVPLMARVRFRWAIPVTLLLTLGLGLVVPVLDNGAHLGGFLAGFILAWPLRPPRKPAEA
jgi:membrane associated rhomboid family serine protease